MIVRPTNFAEGFGEQSKEPIPIIHDLLAAAPPRHRQRNEETEEQSPQRTEGDG